MSSSARWAARCPSACRQVLLVLHDFQEIVRLRRGHDEILVHVHVDSLRSVHVAGDEALELAVGREHLYAVVVVVGDDDVGASVDAHAVRLPEAALERAVLAEAADEVAVAVEQHHAVVVRVRHVAAAVLVHGDVDGLEEGERGVRPELAEAAAVLDVVHRHAPGHLVDDDHSRPLEVVRDAHRLAEHLVDERRTCLVTVNSG